LGWSRDQLARQVGVDAETIAAWETDAAAISYPMSLQQIFEQNGITPHAPRTQPPRTLPFQPDLRTARR
ncbi:MAG TPA: helix-turn-helix transcriptional regulator, partial [Thermoanaerobaculia bacterium]|nr:helix-turn-helix transcriptional regulator [Thermoanaerobaculia bacterium]